MRHAIQNNGVLLLKSGTRALRKLINIYVLIGTLVVFGWIALLGEARAAGRLSDYLAKAQPAELVAGANRFGPLQGDPAIAPAYKDDQLLGFVYLNSDFANATGYSGKPIQLLIGIDPKGVITGLKLVEHKEPIVLVGIPVARILEAVNKLIGTDMGSVARGAAPAPQVDIVSGATVTVLVMGDSIVRSATKLIKSGRLGGQGNAVASAAPQATKVIDPGKSEMRDWQSLVGDGSVRRLILTVADVNKAFEKSGNAGAVAHPEEGEPDDTFIDLYVAALAASQIRSPARSCRATGPDGHRSRPLLDKDRSSYAVDALHDAISGHGRIADVRSSRFGLGTDQQIECGDVRDHQQRHVDDRDRVGGAQLSRRAGRPTWMA